MAEGLNQVTIFGNLGADPELRVTQSGQSVLKLRLATTETYLDRNNARQERTEWHSVAIWGKRAEALSKFLGKGDRLLIVGSIRTTQYEKQGEKRYSTEVVAKNVILSGRRKHENPGPQARNPQFPEKQHEQQEREPQPSDAWQGETPGDDIPF